MSTLTATVTVRDAAGHTATASASATVGTGAGRFPGDPGTGKLMMGVNDPPSTTQGSWQAVEAAMPAPGLSLHRLYTSGQWTLPTVDMAAAVSRGQVPVVSIGYAPYADPQSVPQSAVDSLAAQMRAFQDANPDARVWLVPGLHEPENDNPKTGTGQATVYDPAWHAGYRSTGRKLVLALRAAGVTIVAVCGAAYMNCTFTGTCPGRKWWWWHLDWKGTLSGTAGTVPAAADFYSGTGAAARLVDIDCMDIYTPLIGTQTWTSPATQLQNMLGAFAAGGYVPRPVAVMELGVKSDTASTPVDYTRGPAMMQAAFDAMLANNGVGIIWWTTGGNSFGSGPTPASDPDDPGDPDTVGEREEKLKALVADSRHYHL